MHITKKYTRALVLMVSFSFASPAFSGRPILKDETCPIGGEVFEITVTSSCSSMGHYLSLRPMTSCDFVTHLPQCPSNHLPMYKEFTESDLDELAMIIASKEFAELKSGSPYYLANIVDKALSSSDSELQFHILQTGLWYEAQNWEDATYMDDYFTASDLYLKTNAEVDRYFWMGARAYVHLRFNETAKAKKFLDQAKREGPTDNEYFTQYISALETCISGQAAEELCGSAATIRDHNSK